MRYFEGTTEFYSEVPTAVTLGKFDGLHRGHQKLIRCVEAQKVSGLAGAVFVIAPQGSGRLLTKTEKRKRLEEMGIDLLVDCPFIPEILSMEPEQFVSEILVEKLKAKYVVVGTDFRFGYRRSGDAWLLQALQEKYGIRVEIIEKECRGSREISSTYIREAMQAGEMGLVSELLGYPYSVAGTVQHGKQLGRRIGMPTVNLVPEQDKLLPPNGVYYTGVKTEGSYYHGITNIGCKPTVDGSFIGVETYLYGFDGNLYGKDITVELLAFRRPEMKFSSVGELKAQMERDIQAGKEYFREW